MLFRYIKLAILISLKVGFSKLKYYIKAIVCDGTKLEQAVDHKHSIYYEGGKRVGETTGLKPLTAQTTVVA